MNQWGKYIPENKLEIVSLAIREPIQVSSIGMKARANPQNRLGQLISRIRDPQDVDGHTEQVDGFRFIKMFAYMQGIERYSRQSLESAIAIYRERLGLDYNEAKKHFARAYFQSIHAHESAHVCSDKSVSSWFQEIGARYYQSEVIRDIYGKDEVQQDTIIDNHDFYQGLINQYGNNVHKYFFGAEINPKIRRAILLKSFTYISRDTIRDIFNIHQ